MRWWRGGGGGRGRRKGMKQGLGRWRVERDIRSSGMLRRGESQWKGWCGWLKFLFDKSKVCYGNQNMGVVGEREGMFQTG